MTRDEAIAAALEVLDDTKTKLESRIPLSADENASLLQRRNARGWRIRFRLAEEPPEQSFVVVEVAEPSGKIFIVPML